MGRDISLAGIEGLLSGLPDRPLLETGTCVFHTRKAFSFPEGIFQ